MENLVLLIDKNKKKYIIKSNKKTNNIIKVGKHNFYFRKITKS